MKTVLFLILFTAAAVTAVGAGVKPEIQKKPVKTSGRVIATISRFAYTDGAPDSKARDRLATLTRSDEIRYSLMLGRFYNFQLDSNVLEKAINIKNADIDNAFLRTIFTNIHPNVLEYHTTFAFPAPGPNPEIDDQPLYELTESRPVVFQKDTDFDKIVEEMMDSLIARAATNYCMVKLGEMPELINGRAWCLSVPETTYKNGILSISWKLKIQIEDPYRR